MAYKIIAPTATMAGASRAVHEEILTDQLSNKHSIDNTDEIVKPDEDDMNDMKDARIDGIDEEVLNMMPNCWTWKMSSFNGFAASSSWPSVAVDDTCIECEIESDAKLNGIIVVVDDESKPVLFGAMDDSSLASCIASESSLIAGEATRGGCSR